MAGISGGYGDNGRDGSGARLQQAEMVKVMVEISKQGRTDSVPAQVKSGMGDVSGDQVVLLPMRCNNKDMSVLFLDMWKELAALQARVEELEQTVNVPRAGVGEADKKKAKAGHAGRDGGAKEKKRKKHKKK